MYTEANTAKMKSAESEILECADTLNKADQILQNVYHALGSMDGDAVQEFRRKLKIRDENVKACRKQTKTIAASLDQIINLYEKTEDKVTSEKNSTGTGGIWAAIPHLNDVLLSAPMIVE